MRQQDKERAFWKQLRKIVDESLKREDWKGDAAGFYEKERELWLEAFRKLSRT